MGRIALNVLSSMSGKREVEATTFTIGAVLHAMQHLA